MWSGVNISGFLPSTVSKLLLVIERHRVKRSSVHLSFAVKYTCTYFVLWLKALVNDYVVTFRQSLRFLGRKSIQGVNMSCLRHNTAPKQGSKPGPVDLVSYNLPLCRNYPKYKLILPLPPRM